MAIMKKIDYKLGIIIGLIGLSLFQYFNPTIKEVELIKEVEKPYPIENRYNFKTFKIKSEIKFEESKRNLSVFLYKIIFEKFGATQTFT